MVELDPKALNAAVRGYGNLSGIGALHPEKIGRAITAYLNALPSPNPVAAGTEGEPPLYFIVGKFSDEQWHYCAGPADLSVLQNVLPGWRKNHTPTACIVSTAHPNPTPGGVTVPEGMIELLQKVQRFNTPVYDDLGMQEADDGEWVRVDDLEAALAASPSVNEGRP